MPLVIMLHGGMGSGRQASRHYGWSQKADAEGFCVVYPDGTGPSRTWNGPHCCGYAHANQVDDVGFILALIEKLSATLPIDPRRVFAAGMSNGGMLAHRLGAEHPEVFAGIAPVAAMLGGRPHEGGPLQLPDPPSQPVPIIIFHGRQDQHVLYEGGSSPLALKKGRTDLSVAEVIAFWVRANRCRSTPDITTNDTGHVVRHTYPHDGDGADVVLYEITNQGHAWPGSRKPRIEMDEPSTEIRATNAIWGFFAAQIKQ
jgi:polyhydroxybutyrate depolymerase